VAIELYEMKALLFLLACAILAHGAMLPGVLRIRGGLVPQPSEDGEYYEKFKIDYGCDDNVRIAGSMRGLIKSGKLTSLPHADPFIRWLNEKLEKGPQPPGGRVKPFYVSRCTQYLSSGDTFLCEHSLFYIQAADFGTKKDLKAGENPVQLLSFLPFSTISHCTLYHSSHSSETHDRK
jgi:hypothetical protein